MFNSRTSHSNLAGTKLVIDGTGARALNAPSAAGRRGFLAEENER